MSTRCNKRVFVSLFTGMLLSLSTLATSAALVGSLDGDANNDMGNLSYKLPLQTPSGPNGIKPTIGLSYQSGSNTGFSLYGSSVITRCAATENVDGFKGQVGFNAIDRYCLDGQRLVAITGADGQEGTVYSTYLRNFSKITSTGGSSNNPGTWEVRTKDGWILTYGSDSYSRDTQANGNYRWYLVSKEDRFGNTLAYSYSNESGKKILSNISYSEHDIELIYINTDSTVTKYEYGKAYSDNQLLDRIEIKTEGTLRRYYQLTYEKAGVANIDRLKAVALCDGDDSCTKPTQFSWHDGDNLDPMLREDRNIYSGAGKFARYHSVDVTGEGNPEVCYYDIGANDVVCNDKRSNVGKTFENERNVVGTLQFQDLNNDGYTDYCISGDADYTSPQGGSGDGTYCARNQRDGTFSSIRKWSNYIVDINKTDEIKTQYIDINNDKFSDLCVQTKANLKCWLNNKSSNFVEEKVYQIKFSFPVESMFLDANGDGRNDICGYTSDGLACYINTSTPTSVSFSGRQLWSKHEHFKTVKDNTPDRGDWTGVSGQVAILNEIATKNYSLAGSLRATDFNGDALPDLCYLRDDHLYCAMNDGTSFNNIQAVTSISLNVDGGWGPEPTKDDASNLRMVDINHDGLVDACTHYSSGSYYCAYNNGGGKLGAMQEYAQLDPMLDLYELPGYGHTECITTSYSITGAITSFLESVSGVLSGLVSTGDGGRKDQCGNVYGTGGPITFVDVNSDAKIDVCYHSRSGVSCALSESIAGSNLLKGVETPYKTTEFEYMVLSDSSSYKESTTSKNRVLPISPSFVALKSVVTDNPAGSNNTLSYEYSGLLYHLDDGMRAFETITKTHSATNQKTVSHFHQEGKLNGRAKTSTVYVDDSKVSEKEFTYQEIAYGKAYEIRNWKTITKSFKFRGFQYKTHSQAYSNYDDFGNPQVATEFTNILGKDKFTPGGSKRITTKTTFWNDEDKWLIGKPLTVSVEHYAVQSTTAQDILTKDVTFEYDSRGVLVKEVKQPDHPLELTSEFTYDGYGNKLSTTVTDKDDNTRSSSSTYADNGLYPVTVTNQLGHKQSFTYDSFCNQALTSTGPNGLTTSWSYDSLCRKVLETRADDTETKITYAFSDYFDLGIDIPNTSQYKVTTESSGSSAVTAYFDAFGNQTRTRKTGFNGEVVLTDNRYNERGLLTANTLPYFEGYFSGDGASWVTTEYDLIGRKINQTRETENGDVSVQFSYDGNVATTIDGANNTRTVTTNVHGNIASVTEPDGGTIENSYDSAGNLLTVAINGKQTSAMQYDIMNNKIAMDDVSMGKWTYQYNAFGELIQQTDAKLQVTNMTYDILGRLIKRQSPDELSEFTYDTSENGIGKVAQEKSPIKTVTYHYDSLGRAESIQTLIDDQEFEQGIGYDAYSRPSVINYPNDVEIKRNYTEQGYLKSLSMPKSQIWTPNLLGLEKAMKAYMQKIEELNIEASQYEEQALFYIAKADKVRELAQHYERVAEWKEDYADRLYDSAKRYDTRATYWVRKSSTFRSQAKKYYSQMGNSYLKLSSKSSSGWVKYKGSKKRGKHRTHYTWNLKGFYSANAWPKYLHVGKLFNSHASKYDGYASRYRSYAASNRSRAATYDKQAIEDRKQAAILKVEAQGYYDDASILTDKMAIVLAKLGDYSGAVEVIQDNLDELAKEAEGHMILWAATSRDASDRLSGQVYGNGILTRKVYDSLSGRLVKITSEHGDTQLRDLAFAYNGNNSVIQRTDKISGVTHNYSYDAKDQLIDFMQISEGSQEVHSYAYDTSGNMTNNSNVGSMTYGEGNRLTQLTRNDESINTYQYDANGNQISSSDRTIAWTSFNKASQITAPGSITELDYDSNQGRALQTVTEGSHTESTYYVGGGYEYVTDTRNDVEKYRINLYAGNELVGVYVKSLTEGNPEIDRLRYFHKDALGSVDLVTDIDGKVVARQSYSPFGQRKKTMNDSLKAKKITNFIKKEHQAEMTGSVRISKTSASVAAVSMETNRGFTGHEHLGNGLINMNARLYDPEVGRFLSADTFIQSPNLLLSHNRYTYVMNNPLKYTDPSGHFWNFVIGAAISYAASQSDNVYVRTAGMIVGSAIAGGAFGGEALFASAAMNNVAVGATMGGISGGTVESAAIGGLSAGFAYGIGHGGADGAGIFNNFLGQATAHGFAQGIIAEASGGEFTSGFASGFIGHASGAATSGIGGNGGGAVLTRTTVAAVFGGVAAEATGGNFEDGAMQATMVHLFNQEAGRLKQQLTNPTSGTIRSDDEGDGKYGSPRGKRDHLGVDITSSDGQNVLSPIDGKAVNYTGSSTGYPIVDIIPTHKSLGIDRIRILYVGSNSTTPSGSYSVSQGSTIGKTVNLQGLGYSNGVTPHVHVQIQSGGRWVDPTPYLFP